MRILLADDHNLVRDSLSALICHYSTGAEVVGVDCLDAALDALKRGPAFDLVVRDMRMPGMTGLIGLQKVIPQWPKLPIVLMSGWASDGDVEVALALGARGYLPKTMAGRSLVQALELILAGEVFLPSTALRPGSRRGADGGPDQLVKLSEREHQVLLHLKQGLANKEIARLLGVHETTVKLHLRTLSKKVRANNRTDLVLKAIQLGLVD